MGHDGMNAKRGEKKPSGQAILFRADADQKTGTGHVMRCLALAQALRDRDVPVFFIVTKEFPDIAPRLLREGITIIPIGAEPGSPEDAELTCAAAEKTRASWIVIDGYCFSENYRQQIKNAGYCLMCIDDGGLLRHYHADIILNQNLYAKRRMYKDTAPGTQLLLGGRYALLRREFPAARDRKRRIRKKAGRVLVTLGGSDPDNYTGDIIRALMQCGACSCDVRVIAGGCNPHVHELEALVKHAGTNIVLLHNVDDMVQEYLWADIAICGGGTTTLELACLGIPMITVVISDNQEPVCEFLEKAGAAINMGSGKHHLEERIQEALQKLMASGHAVAELSHHSKKLVDGMGSNRVAQFLAEDSISLRYATPGDSSVVYGWINESYVREQSFNTAPITPEEHSAWFLAKMRDPNAVYFIVSDRIGTPVGQVRYDIAGTDATISILIDAKNRGKNIGTLAMVRSAKKLFEESPVNAIHAYVRPTNRASCRAFINAGFVPEGMTTRGTTEAFHLVFRRA